MKSKNSASIVSAVILLVVVSLACAGGSTPAPTPVPPTDTLKPEPTIPPTSSSTPNPTVTLEPTATLEPTPAPVGIPVRSDTFEVTVLKARILESGVHTGDGYFWTAKPGNLFIELGVKASNLKVGVKSSVPWNHIYVVEDTGDSWYPNWGGSKAVGSGKEIDPSSISVSSIKSGDDLVVFDNDVFLRLIYVVAEKKPTIVHFGFDNSPMIEIVVNN